MSDIVLSADISGSVDHGTMIPDSDLKTLTLEDKAQKEILLMPHVPKAVSQAVYEVNKM